MTDNVKAVKDESGNVIGFLWPVCNAQSFHWEMSAMWMSFHRLVPHEGNRWFGVAVTEDMAETAMRSYSHHPQ